MSRAHPAVKVRANLRDLERRLGREALRWVQLGPPALSHLPEYRIAQLSGQIDHIGVEDFSAEMLDKMSRSLRIATVQQEVNLLVRPSAASIAFCERHGCKFVAYGPLLGGLLSDLYLGQEQAPHPDADHSKVWDYLDSIEAWGGWSRFQRLLRVLRQIADAHDGATIAPVSAAYLLQLPYMLAMIVGVRLHSPEGHGTHHKLDSLRALTLTLTPSEVALIDDAVAAGSVLDGLSRT